MLVYRRTAAATGVQSDTAIAARNAVANAFRAYRLAIAELADAVAGFRSRNVAMGGSEVLNDPPSATDIDARERRLSPAPVP